MTSKKLQAFIAVSVGVAAFAASALGADASFFGVLSGGSAPRPTYDVQPQSPNPMSPVLNNGSSFFNSNLSAGGVLYNGPIPDCGIFCNIGNNNSNGAGNQPYGGGAQYGYPGGTNPYQNGGQTGNQLPGGNYLPGGSSQNQGGTLPPNYYAQINSFEQCAALALPVQESYPRRCVLPDGRSFTENVPPPQNPYQYPQYPYSQYPSGSGSFFGNTSTFFGAPYGSNNHPYQSVYNPQSIRVNSPGPGEQLAFGSNKQVSWSAPSGVNYVNIHLIPSTNLNIAPYLIGRNVQNVGTATWFITNVDDNGLPIPAGQYKLRISDASSSGMYGESALFSISQSGQLASPQFTSPVGGERWMRGSVRTVSWTGFSGPVNVYMQNSAVCPMSSGLCRRQQMRVLVATGVTGNSIQWNVNDAAWKSPQTFGTPASDSYQLIVTDGTNTITSNSFTIFTNLSCASLSSCPRPQSGYQYVRTQDDINNCRCGTAVPINQSNGSRRSFF